MKKILKQSSRLILVFILTMIVAGGILTYLSINSISNLRELTEKKVLEEQQNLAEQLSARFFDMMVKVSRQFSSLVYSGASQTRDSILSLRNLPYAQLSFVLDSNGEFLNPWVPRSVFEEEHTYSPTYRHYLELAQKNEFQHRNFAAAAYNYRKSMEHASGKPDSAKSTNAMARVNFKMEEFEKSYAAYSQIHTNYSQVLDDNGFPYAYYAILSLLRLNESDSAFKFYPHAIHFMVGIQTGRIPVNRSTGDILARINTWKEGSPETDSSRIQNLDAHLEQIKQILRFVDSYAELFRVRVSEWKDGRYQPQLEEFLLISDPSAHHNQIVVIEPREEYLPGFCMILDSLWSGIMSDGYQDQSEFGYAITLREKEANGKQIPKGLVTRAMLSSYFPMYEISIGLQNPDIIEQFIKKRSWSYGIALILLLGAMLLGVVLIIRDLNRERHLAHLRSDFVSNVSHELKTPLTSIHVFAESVLLDRVKSSADQKEYLKIVLKETERLKRMINNILDFSKKEKGKLFYQTKPVDVTALLRSAVDDLSYWLEELNFRVNTDLQEGVITNGDSEALKQVILNLLENAIKYSDKVKEIDVKLSKEEKRIRIEVADKGIGIAEDQISRIFEKFYRVNNKEVEGIGGTGLGLTVVKEIVDAHKGNISVHSVPGKGSNFIIELNSM